MILSVNQFRANLKHYVDNAIDNHEPLTVSRKNGEAFVVLSLDDYNREQETLYVLNNNTLMGQVEESFLSYKNKSGHKPSADELNLDGDD
ncbi:MAG: Antitoxin [uncultured Sulfurovum sp.]|uniref:Antitoxin n=1 Tax=uncultured Sulfurovum sp. TaxID=269237 RepID=A0A6S6TPR2_9BACT|nr:MAG: Antitoxin [uncultured Sulfurovum sp.]